MGGLEALLAHGVFGTESETKTVAERLFLSVGIQLYSSQPPPAGHPESRASGVASTQHRRIESTGLPSRIKRECARRLRADCC